MPKKTYISELSALGTIGFSVYQGYKHGVINPDLIGQAILHSYDLAMIIIPPALLAVRLTYKKWFRKPKEIDAPSGPIHYYDFTKPMDSKEIEQLWLKNKGANIIATDREAMKNEANK